MAFKYRARAVFVASAMVAGLARIAAGQLASRPAEEWAARLERPERIAGLKIDYIIQKLELKPGQVVADIGAGPGVISIPIAKAVAPGKVYAEDIDRGFFDHVDKRAREQQVTNVVNVLGTANDPKLPARDVDVALFHDVLHHIEKRAEYLKAAAAYLKPGGRIAVVELPPDGSHKDEPALVVTKDQVKQWMADAGLKPVQEFDGLEGKWFIVYGKS